MCNAFVGFSFSLYKVAYFPLPALKRDYLLSAKQPTKMYQDEISMYKVHYTCEI
jgi:hypothetical protein